MVAVFGKPQVTAFEMAKYFKQHMFGKVRAPLVCVAVVVAVAGCGDFLTVSDGAQDEPPLSHSVTQIVTPETKPKDPNAPPKKKKRAAEEESSPLLRKRESSFQICVTKRRRAVAGPKQKVLRLASLHVTAVVCVCVCGGLISLV
jgi:hypothetical protein